MIKIHTIWVIKNKAFGDWNCNNKIYRHEKDAKAALTRFQKDPKYGLGYKIVRGELWY